VNIKINKDGHSYNVLVKTSLWNHMLVYLNGQLIFTSEKDSGAINDDGKKVLWFKYREKDRLINFLKNEYYKIYSPMLYHL
jgi:hypothetical protein